jgi:hypothetical protein
MKSRRKFTRPLGNRRYRKLFVIAVEGSVTEPDYFKLFQNNEPIVHVKCLTSLKGSSPQQVLRRITDHLKGEKLRNTDEAWLVVDKDNWTEMQLNELFHWSKQSENYGFALSNPKFELWLLFHYDDGKGVNSSRRCSDRLKKYLPNYDKGIDVRNIRSEMIDAAIIRAKTKDMPPCLDWPHKTGTTVYRLVERLLCNE